MVADILNFPAGAIHFGLQITSCDCHMTEILARQAADIEKKCKILNIFGVIIAKK